MLIIGNDTDLRYVLDRVVSQTRYAKALTSSDITQYLTT